jgi:uncharacterized membrane protein YtjA (UPF0391 family)
MRDRNCVAERCVALAGSIVCANTRNPAPGDNHARDHNVAARSTADRDHPALSDLLIRGQASLSLRNSKILAHPRAGPELRRPARRFPGDVYACTIIEPTRRQSRAPAEETVMGNLLHYALVFLVVALIAAAVGFGGVAGVAMEGARLLFWVFIILFLVSLVAGVVRRG